MKRLALAFVLSAVGCAAQLATLPPSDNYVMVEGDGPRLTGDEQKLFDAINKRFVEYGLPAATLGSYEQNAAAIMANAALAKIWHGSGRAVAQQDSQEIAPPVSGQEGKTEAKHQVANGRLASLTDEQDDTELKHMHTGQHLTAHGLPQLSVHVFQAIYAQTKLEGDDLESFVRSVRPDGVRGELKMGVAILPAGDADKRLFAVAIRDRVFDVTKGPPRYPTPGTTFDFAGVSYERDLKSIRIALLAPDGKVTFGHAPVDAQGNFATTMTIPSFPGLYEFAARAAGVYYNLIDVPIFAGVPPTPWPVAADPNTLPVDGTRAVSQRLANAIAEWRHSHSAVAVPIDVNLSAFAKNEAGLWGKAADDESGAGSGSPAFDLDLGWHDRVRQAGFDPAAVHWYHFIYSDDYVNDFFARFPGGPFAAAALESASMEKIGIGVTLVPNRVSKDKDRVAYSIEWVIQDPTPAGSEPPPISNAQPLTVAVRADGTVAVDGTQVDDAQLKLRADAAKGANADVTVVLQVEEGAKPELVQHVTDLVKGEGIISIVSHPPEPPVPGTPASPGKSW